MRRTTMLTATMLTAIVAVMLVATACGGGASATGQPHQTVSNPAGGSAHPSGPETNPAGDIPDTTVFVPYTDTPGQFTVNVPQGWARTQQGSAVVFTDKLNSVRLDAHPAGSAPTVASARAAEVPQITAGGGNVRIDSVRVVHRTAGDAVEIAYSTDSPPDSVTGKTVREAVERFEFFHNGSEEVVVTLSGPVGADNADPWRTVIDSIKWAS